MKVVGFWMLGWAQKEPSEALGLTIDLDEGLHSFFVTVACSIVCVVFPLSFSYGISRLQRRYFSISMLEWPKNHAKLKIGT